MMNDSRLTTEEFQSRVMGEPAETCATGCIWLPVSTVAMRLLKKKLEGKVVTWKEVNPTTPAMASLMVMIEFPGSSTVAKSKNSTITEAPPLRTAALPVWGSRVYVAGPLEIFVPG